MTEIRPASGGCFFSGNYLVKRGSVSLECMLLYVKHLHPQPAFAEGDLDYIPFLHVV